MGHHRQQPVDQIVDKAEAAGLPAVAIKGDGCARQRLADDVADHPAVIGVHPRAIGIEDPHHPHVGSIGAVEVQAQGLRSALALVIAGARPGAVDPAAIILALGVDFRIAIDLAGRSQQEARALLLGEAQKVAGAEHVGQQRMLGILLIMRRGGGAGQVEDPGEAPVLDRGRQGLDHVMADEVEAGAALEMREILGPTG